MDAEPGGVGVPVRKLELVGGVDLCLKIYGLHRGLPQAQGLGAVSRFVDPLDLEGAAEAIWIIL